MPIWMRRYHIQKINEFNKKQKEELEKSTKGKTAPSNRPTGPNINPSSTYNF